MFVKEFYRTQKTIIPSFNVTSAAQTKNINGFNCTIQCLTGNLWINANATATAANGFKLAAGQSINMNAVQLSLISDGTGATAQIMVWND